MAESEFVSSADSLTLSGQAPTAVTEQVIEELQTMDVQDDVDSFIGNVEQSTSQPIYSTGNVMNTTESTGQRPTVRIVKSSDLSSASGIKFAPRQTNQLQSGTQGTTPVIAIRGNQVYKLQTNARPVLNRQNGPTAPSSGRLVMSNSGSPVKLQLISGNRNSTQKPVSQQRVVVTAPSNIDRKPMIIQQQSPPGGTSSVVFKGQNTDKVQYVRVVPSTLSSPRPSLRPGTSYLIGRESNVNKQKGYLRTLAPATTASGEILTVGELAKRQELQIASQPKIKKTQQLGHRKPCNCTKSGCLKLYCDCFANGEFCLNCNCKECRNNLEYESERSKSIKSCLDRNPNAFQPKIGKGRSDIERLHQKGCHCKKSNCLKNYCECYEAKVPCTNRCKCTICRNTETDRHAGRHHRDLKVSSGLLNLAAAAADARAQSPMSDFEGMDSNGQLNPKSMPWFYMTDEVVEATTLCLVAQAEEMESQGMANEQDMEKAILKEFGKCLQQIIQNAAGAS